MKQLILFIPIFFFLSCNFKKRDNTQTNVTIQKKTINKDSIDKAKRILESHWGMYKDVYTSLHIDSLKNDSSEMYRLAIAHSWGQNEYGGKETSITFHKNADTCYVVIIDLLYNIKDSIYFPRKIVKFIPETYFDSIRIMFDKGTFWKRPMACSTCGYTRCSDPNHLFFEAIKNGKHKLVSQQNDIDSIPILKNWKYNFYHFSSYNKQFEKDWKPENARFYE